MSTTLKISPEEFGHAMGKIVKRYGEEAYEVSMECAKSASRAATKDLKASAPSGGSYARGWSHKAQKNGITRYSETVYNRIDYQLTHLLEKAHATGGGGHYPKNVDYTGTIASVEEKQAEKYIQEVLSKL